MYMISENNVLIFQSSTNLYVTRLHVSLRYNEFLGFFHNFIYQILVKMGEWGIRQFVNTNSIVRGLEKVYLS